MLGLNRTRVGRGALVLCALVLCAVALLVLSGGRSGQRPPGAVLPHAPSERAVARARLSTAPRAAALHPDPQPAAAPSAPVIDEVIVEKPELCAGEETLVTVRAHTPDDSDAELHYRIGTGTGQSVPLRAWLDEQGQPPAFEATVFGRGNSASTVRVPPLRIRACRVGTFVVLTHRSLPNRWATFALRAELRAAPGSPASVTLRPRRYRWSFGDGSREESSSPEVIHSYEERPQLSLYSQFLVRVEVTGGDGRPLIARDALQLPNPAYEAWTRKGIVSLMVALDPPFPVLNAARRVEQGVRLRHYRPEAVTIDAVQAVRYSSKGSGPPQPIDVAALLGTNQIPAGPGLELQLTLDVRAEPEVLSISYYLKGTSAEGRPVIGSFSVMRPPPRPTADNSTPVTDPHLLAKIQRARERLGKDVISAEDLAQLERQGEFEGL